MNLILEYTDKERKRGDEYCKKVIDLLSPLPIREKWLVIGTLYNAFPVDELKAD